jgi:hypothetical protein
MSTTVATRLVGRCPVAKSRNKAPVERLILAHGTASVAMALPWPALLVVTWSSTHSDVWLGVAGAARMAPYVALSRLAGALGDRMPRVRLLRVSTWLRAGLLIVAALLLERGVRPRRGCHHHPRGGHRYAGLPGLGRRDASHRGITL